MLRRCWHFEQAGGDPGKLLKYLGADNYDIRLLEPGVLYRDRWQIGPSGTTNSVASDKEKKRE